MRYRRYYVKRNDDGSKTVVSTGCLIALGTWFWRSIIGTWIIFAIGLALLDPFPLGSTAQQWWVGGGATALSVVYYAVGPGAKRRAARRAQRAKDGS